MNVTHVITGLETGGAETMLTRLVERWRGTPGRTTVLSLRDRGTMAPRLEAAGAEVRTLGMRGSLPGPGAFVRLRRELAARPSDVVQGWMYHGDLAATVGTRRLGATTPVVWNVRHSVYDLAYEKWSTALVIRACAAWSRAAARIIFNSRTSAAQHARLGYDAGRSVVIPNGFDVERFRPDQAARAAWRERLGIGPEVLLVGQVGRWHPMKDFPTFLRMAARVHAERPEVRFAVAGKGLGETDAPFTALVAELGLTGVVQGVGEIADVPGFVAALDVATCSSYSEAFPNVVGEALACGVPVVATDVGDAAWIIGAAGRTVPARDAAAFAAAVGSLLGADAATRRALGAEGRTRVEAEFGIDRIAARYRSLYEEVRATHPGGRV